MEVIQAKLKEDDGLVERIPLSPDMVAEILDMSLRSTSAMVVNSMLLTRCYSGCQPILFEDLTLESAPSRPRLWKHYVDDTCCILRKREVDGVGGHVFSRYNFFM